MQRGGQPRGAQGPGAAGAVAHRHVEPPLKRGVPQGAQKAQQPDVGRAAAEEDVLAVVDLAAGVRVAEAVRLAAQEGAALDQRDLGPEGRALDRGGDPGEPPAAHDEPEPPQRRAEAVRRPISATLWPVESDTRPARTSWSRASIWPRISR